MLSPFQSLQRHLFVWWAIHEVYKSKNRKGCQREDKGLVDITYPRKVSHLDRKEIFWNRQRYQLCAFSLTQALGHSLADAVYRAYSAKDMVQNCATDREQSTMRPMLNIMELIIVWPILGKGRDGVCVF